MLEEYLPGELLEEKKIRDGRLQIREMNSLDSDKNIYTLYLINPVSSMALTPHYKKISLKEYQTYFDLVIDRDTFDFLRDVINSRLDSTSLPGL
jgi:hypothetical protein